MAKRTALGWAAHVVNTCIKSAGLTVSKIPERNTLDRQIKTLLATYDIGCVIDVGAHYGEFATSLRELGYTGRIVSFEPSSASFAELNKTKGMDDRWQTHQLCLGDENGTATFNKYKYSTFDSLHTPTKFAKTSWFSEHITPDGTEDVSIRRLDAVLPELGIDSTKVNIYLKIDTQGNDIQVLQGASGILPHINALQTELSALRLYENTPKLEEAIGIYRELGFLPAGFYAVPNPRNPTPVVDWDCVFTRVDAEQLAQA